METISQVNAEILAIIGNIHANYSELANFLKEMPTSFSNNASNEVTLDQLKEYRDSLNELLSNYINHEATSDWFNGNSE